MRQVSHEVDELRSALMGAPSHFARKVMPIHGGQAVELRQPSIGERDELARKATTGGLFSISEFRLWLVINLTFRAGTDERVFDAADIDSLRAMPARSWVDEFADELLILSNVRTETGKEGFSETEKNSEGTPEDKPTS